MWMSSPISMSRLPNERNTFHVAFVKLLFPLKLIQRNRGNLWPKKFHLRQHGYYRQNNIQDTLILPYWRYMIYTYHSILILKDRNMYMSNARNILSNIFWAKISELIKLCVLRPIVKILSLNKIVFFILINYKIEDCIPQWGWHKIFGSNIFGVEGWVGESIYRPFF